MQPLPASSGDLIVDRRLDYAEALAASGDPAAAAALLSDTLDRVPNWSAGWVRLGVFHEAAGARDAAAQAFARALALDPADRFGVTLQLDLLRPIPLAESMPPTYVESLFDSYAESFDASLTQLGYRAPWLLREALPSGRRFVNALDLGCGTGLMGAELRDIAGWLEGWDISAGMLREAGDKGIYDLLAQVDIQAIASPPAPDRDLIVAADVFIYLGALERVFGWVRQALMPDGVFAFTVESCETGFALTPSRRYRHSAGYIARLIRDAGFDEARLTPAILRRERGEPVLGLVVTARAPALRRESEGEAMEGTA